MVWCKVLNLSCPFDLLNCLAQLLHLLRFGGNNFVRETNYPPWNFPTDSIPKEQNSPASANFSAFEDTPSQIEGTHKRNKPNAAAIVLIIGGILLVSSCAGLSVVAHRQKAFTKRSKSLGSNEGSLKSLPTDKLQGKIKLLDFSFMINASSYEPFHLLHVFSA